MRGMLLEFGGAGLCLGVGAMAWAVAGRSSSVFGPSVWRGARDRRAIALTFDDGPSESTPQLLDLLREYGVPATFFLCGENVRRLPEIARRIAREGHQIGNHSDSHPFFCLHSPHFIREQLTRAQRSIAETTGVTPVMFRAPYGVRWFGLREAQKQLGLLGVTWTVIGYDWKLPAGAIARRMSRRASNGAIFCLHDGRDTNPEPDVSPMLEAASRLIPELLERGFRFETVSQILCPTT